MENYDNPSFLVSVGSREKVSTVHHNDPITSGAAKVIDFLELNMGKTIGEGSFGYVRLGRWRGMGVAVKLLKENITDRSTESRDRQKFLDELTHEVTAMTRVCNHSFVVQLVGVVFQPIPCIVTTYYEYGSLEDLLVKNTRGVRDAFTLHRLMQFSIESCLGVHHLHLEGVIHRDLAARNLLLDQNFHVRVSDFGFSRFKESGASKGYTQSTVGPIRWTAPEAMRKRVFSEASDVFSLGVVLYELFAQCVPWEECDTIDVAVRVCSGERMDVPSTVPDAVRQLMCECWSQEPSSRPTLPSVVEFLEGELLRHPVVTPDPLTASMSAAFSTPAASAEEGATACHTEAPYVDFLTLPAKISSVYATFNTLDTTTASDSSSLAELNSEAESEYAAFPSLYLQTSSSSQSGNLSDGGLTEGDGADSVSEDRRHREGEREGEYMAPTNTSLLLQTDTSKITDSQFLEHFFANKLQSWGHESMLRLIYLLLQRSGRSSKTVKEIFTVLRDFQKDAFHMTIAYFWIQLVTYAIEVCKQDVMMAVFNVDNSEARLLQLSFLEFILQPHCTELRDSHLYLRYYTQSGIDSGKVEFQMPDRQQLPSAVLLKGKYGTQGFVEAHRSKREKF
jgi:serine/threonine protein kinase